MEKASKFTANVKRVIAIAVVAFIGFALTISFFLTLELVAAFLSLFITVGFLAVLLFVGLTASRLDAVRGDLRRLEKIMNDTAGSAGKSAPLIREIHGSLGLRSENGSGIYVPSPDPQQPLLSDAVTKLSTALEDREKLESQALRQIVAEARLIRMYVERVGNNDGTK